MKFKAICLIFIYFAILLCLVTINYFAIYSGRVSYIDLIPKHVGSEQQLPQLVMYNIKLAKNNADIVFVGNSRTKYNVDSKVVSQVTGMSTYNSGMASFYYFYWSTIIPSILSNGRHKVIIFQIEPAEFLYSSGIINLDVSQADALNGDYNSLDSLAMFFTAYYSKYVSLKELFSYSIYTMTNYLKFSYIETAFKNILLDSNSNINSEKPCHLAQIFGRAQVYHCLSNDGYIQIKRTPEYKILTKQDFENSAINPTTLFFLQKYISEVKLADDKPIIVLLPSFGVHTSININQLKSVFNVEIIDMSNVNIEEPAMWSDMGHLSISGRLEYSKILGNKLKAILVNK